MGETENMGAIEKYRQAISDGQGSAYTKGLTVPSALMSAQDELRGEDGIIRPETWLKDAKTAEKFLAKFREGLKAAAKKYWTKVKMDEQPETHQRDLYFSMVGKSPEELEQEMYKLGPRLGLDTFNEVLAQDPSYQRAVNSNAGMHKGVLKLEDAEEIKQYAKAAMEGMADPVIETPADLERLLMLAERAKGLVGKAQA